MMKKMIPFILALSLIVTSFTFVAFADGIGGASAETPIIPVPPVGGDQLLIGDIDGDGQLSDWDGILFGRYLAGWDVDIPDYEALDIDADGEITDWDGVLLDRYLAGWPVELG